MTFSTREVTVIPHFYVKNAGNCSPVGALITSKLPKVPKTLCTARHTTKNHLSAGVFSRACASRPPVINMALNISGCPAPCLSPVWSAISMASSPWSDLFIVCKKSMQRNALKKEYLDDKLDYSYGLKFHYWTNLISFSWSCEMGYVVVLPLPDERWMPRNLGTVYCSSKKNRFQHSLCRYKPGLDPCWTPSSKFSGRFLTSTVRDVWNWISLQR